MKGLIVIAGFLLIAFFAFGQSADQNPEKQPKIKEVPASSNHGKTVSELAKTTPGGPEKGKIISSAARQQGIQKREGINTDNSSNQEKNNRPGQTGKPEVTGKGVGKNGTPPRAIPPSKPRPGGFQGG